MKNSPDDFYSLLGVSRKADVAEIRKAYRKLVLDYHPDRNPDNPEAEERFKKVQEAYQTISDVNRRADYDLTLDAREGFARARETPETSRESPFRSRARRKSSREDREREGRYRRSPINLDSDFKSNEFEGRDLLLGVVVAATAFLWLRPGFVGADSKTDAIWFFVWALGPLLWSPIGFWFGSGIKNWAINILDSLSRPLIIWEAMARLLPLVGAIFGAWLSIWISRFIGVPLSTDGLVPATFAAALSASFGSAFGRAFTSVSSRPGAKLFGMAVGAVLGGVSATLLSLFLVSLWLKPSGDSNFWDDFSNGTLAAILGGALGSAAGSLRSTPS